jgi:hypothetical protein
MSAAKRERAASKAVSLLVLSRLPPIKDLKKEKKRRKKLTVQPQMLKFSLPLDI